MLSNEAEDRGGQQCGNTKTTELKQPRPQPELLRRCRPFFLIMASTTEVILPDIAIVFQIWSTLAGNEGLAGGFEPIRNEEMFWMNNNLSHGLCRNAN